MNCYIDDHNHIFLVGAKLTLCKRNISISDDIEKSNLENVLDIDDLCDECKYKAACILEEKLMQEKETKFSSNENKTVSKTSQYK